MNKFLALLALGASASAQMMNLTATLAGAPTLSNLTSILGGYPALVSTLAAAKNITILAPSNAAFAKFMSGPYATMDNATIEAVLMYHVLAGTYEASALNSTTPMFLHTLLNNTAFSNVTGGQVVEASTMGSTVSFYSGLLTDSTVTMAVSVPSTSPSKKSIS